MQTQGFSYYNNVQPLNCTIGTCLFSFSEFIRWHGYQRTTLCSKLFTAKRSLMRHIRAKHEKWTHTCTKCENTFQHRTHTVRHEKNMWRPDRPCVFSMQEVMRFGLGTPEISPTERDSANQPNLFQRNIWSNLNHPRSKHHQTGSQSIVMSSDPLSSRWGSNPWQQEDGSIDKDLR